MLNKNLVLKDCNSYLQQFVITLFFTIYYQHTDLIFKGNLNLIN